MVASKEQNLNFFAKSFVSGGVAGMVSKTAVAPLDRLKILLQVHHNQYRHFGVLSGLKGIVRNENFFALYRGNGAQMVRIFPYAAVQFLSFEFYKKGLNNMMPGSQNHSLKFVAGACAGVTAAASTYPLDFVRARLAYNVANPVASVHAGTVTLGHRPTIVSTFVNVVRTEGGFVALYKGLTPTLLAMVPYAGFSFYCFERLKHLLLNNFAAICAKPGTDQKVLSVPAKLLCGGFAGAIAQTFSYPLDVTRRRMQLSMLNQDTQKYSKSLVQTLRLVYNEYGIKNGLYRGMSINYIRAIPMVAVSFSTYEIMKQQLGLDTGVDS